MKAGGIDPDALDLYMEWDRMMAKVRAGGRADRRLSDEEFRIRDRVSAAESHAFNVAHAQRLGTTPDASRALGALYFCQHRVLHVALGELKDQQRKSSCWAWYAFPTGTRGRNDEHGTYLTDATAQSLMERVESGRTNGYWRRVLELLSTLVRDSSIFVGGRSISDVLPSEADRQRVREFVAFWRPKQYTPLWLHNVLSDLDYALEGA